MGKVKVIELPQAGGMEMEVLGTTQVTSLFSLEKASVNAVPFPGGWKPSNYKRIAVSMRGSVTLEPYYSSSSSGYLGIGLASGDDKGGWLTKQVGKGEKKRISFTDEETLVVSTPYGRRLSIYSGGGASVSWLFPLSFSGGTLTASADTSGIATAVNDTGNGIGVYYMGSVTDVSLVFTLYGIKE